MKNILCTVFASVVITLHPTPVLAAESIAVLKKQATPAQQYIDFALKACTHSEKQIPEMTRVANIVAKRYIAGGAIGLLGEDVGGTSQGLTEEIMGRSGQMMHVGFSYFWKKDRTDAERTNDIIISGWTRGPTPEQIQKLKDFKQKHCYLIGFGPRDLPALAEVVKLSDAWFDNGYGSNDAAITFLDGTHAGHGNLLGDALNAWSFMGELIASFTRHGKMPPIGKSLSYEDGLTWWNKYFKKEQFQDDFKVPPVPAGKLAHAYLEAIRGLLRKYESTQLPAVYKTADLIANELASGKKTIVADIGHMPWAYVGKDESAAWAIASNETLYSHVPSGWANYEKTTPDGALVLRLGYCGHHRDEHAVLKKKNQRVMLITAENPRPEWQLPKDLLTTIDMGWKFGDACVTIPGYPVRILPPSGVMQLVAFETVNVEVLSYLNHAAHTKAAPTPVAK